MENDFRASQVFLDHHSSCSDVQCEDHLDITMRKSGSRYRERATYIHSILNTALTIILVLFWLITTRYNDPGCQEAHALDQEQAFLYSPALQATRPGSRITRLNHTRWSPFNPSHGGSLEDADRNWTRILRVGMTSLSEEDLIRIGAKPDAVKLPEESGGCYLAFTSSHHQLHCLYLLHQSLHPDYYSSRSPVWRMEAKLRLSHWNHYVEILRQYVTCQADTTMIMMYWEDGLQFPAPDNGNPRKCADWDSHFRWQLDHQAPAPAHPLTRPPGASGITPIPEHPPDGYLSMYLGSQ
ncbi:hypothetical protein F5Y17DRAFT_415087 [Xylariaceae sp. FL0594]|nr:hypothetical protein F5Y17DRAFT_415087 [Xylariaceae sp. FL0594]